MFTTSKKPWQGYADADLTGSDLEDFLAAQAAGDDELAAQIVTDAYGLDPEFVLRIDDISGFDDPMVTAAAEAASHDRRR